MTSSLPWEFKENTHQTAVEGEDYGVCLFKSRSLAFPPCMTAEIALKQIPWAPITEVISCAFASLGLYDRAFEPALDWLQASLMDQADGTYTGYIRTCRYPQPVKFAAGSYQGNALLAHLRSAFPGHFLPEPAQTWNKRRRGRRGE